jgi:DNA-binding PadR family transcriptional regulator
MTTLSSTAPRRERQITLDGDPQCVYIVVMAVQAPLGEFEIVVLMATLHLGRDAYGSSIRQEIETRSGRAVSRGAVYITLDRLESKGLLASKLGESTTARGGRPKRMFRVTTTGVKAVRHSVGLLTRMHKGLEPVLGEL